jgi:hypothetical protein
MKKWLLGLIIFVAIMILLFIGRMISPPSFSPPFGCSETDGGRDYYTRGVLTIVQEPVPAPTPTQKPARDTSSTLTLDDSEIKSEEKVAPVSEPGSDDSNTLSPDSPKATDQLIGLGLSPDESFEDSCVDSKNVKEYYCDGEDSYATQNKFCPNGCENGACIKGREPYCSHVGTDQEGWYSGETGALIRHAQCDGDSPKCKTPGFSGVMQ